jgi:hypothetical protein
MTYDLRFRPPPLRYGGSQNRKILTPIKRKNGGRKSKIEKKIFLFWLFRFWRNYGNANFANFANFFFRAFGAIVRYALRLVIRCIYGLNKHIMLKLEYD